RGRARRRSDRRRRRRVGADRGRNPRADADLRRLLDERLRDRLPALRPADRSLAVRRARALARPVAGADGRTANADRRRRPHRPQPPARAAGDAGGAHRRLPRRRSAAATAPDPGRAGPRRHGRDRAAPRLDDTRHRPRHDPERAPRAARRRRPRLRRGRGAMQVRSPRPRSRPARRARSERGVRSRSAGPARAAAAALALLFGGFVALYGWQAWEHGTPIVFIDELLLAQISRAIAATGHPAWRGEPHSFTSLTTYLWAPAWWIHDTKTAYTAVKLIGVVVMASALFPAYA